MVTNRKKIKEKKRKVIFFVILLIGLIIIGGVSAYFIHKIAVSRNKYISPLAKNIPSESSNKAEKDKQFLEKQLKDQKIEYISVDTANQLYSIKLTDDAEVIMASQKDLMTQISSLQFILSRLTMEGKQFKKLDLQFDKPIIIFK